MFFINYQTAFNEEQNQGNNLDLPNVNRYLETFTRSLRKRLFKIVYNMRLNYFLNFKYNLKKKEKPKSIKDFAPLKKQIDGACKTLGVDEAALRAIASGNEEQITQLALKRMDIDPHLFYLMVSIARNDVVSSK